MKSGHVCAMVRGGLLIALMTTSCRRSSQPDDGAIPEMGPRLISSPEGRFRVVYPSICPRPTEVQSADGSRGLRSECVGGFYDVRYADAKVAPKNPEAFLAEREPWFIEIWPDAKTSDVSTGTLGGFPYRRFRVQRQNDHCMSVLFVSAGVRLYSVSAGAPCKLSNPREFIESFALLP